MPPSEKSRCGSGVILYLDNDLRQLVVVPTLCHRWDCPACSRARLAKARAQAAAGKPERIITLTTRPREGLSTEAAVKWIRERWQRLLRRLRRNYPRLEYMAFLELHKSGWPHLHVLTRGCYIPQRVLSAWWRDLTGSFKVHIQKIPKAWKAINEATKYYLKTARQVHAACPALPVYSLSKGWLPDDWHEGDRPAGDRSFYCFCRLPWRAFEGLCEDIGAELHPLPRSPGTFYLTMARPPPRQTSEAIYDMGSYGEAAALSALELYFQDPAAAFSNPASLQDRQDYAARPLARLVDA